ncbi:MAG: 3-isopropylmalate dehydratase large subunit [Theionarchaea archaeon]|nr:3-isopropylmalate dehydratase large subunit [Theionarchaea archaeon]MBU7001999.1 3-isopropylmalate dehydratase large subunit [Theionarchaea archaeon]MBU7019750.1 3-isopropylmalate dehydratase large subunit [Theionarchaea archaeon]MBU7034630.1 3-isopropylmalate dehydratase large subunit [Theionarchaea archaeon]MBU7040613.1 3-isopropylmalate dehydratase large subunit [Theionarchaea archaeon]
MPTLVETIVSKHLRSSVAAGDEIEELPVDRLLVNDVAAVQLVELYREVKDLNPEPFDPSSVFVVLDHVVPPCDSMIADNLYRTKQFARTLHLNLFKEGQGIEHVLLPENNLVKPGDILLGTDSHTCTNGAVGCFAFGVGITDALFVMFTGIFYNFIVPETVLLTCSGSLQKGVYAKDLILYVLSHLDQKKVLNKVLQFSGSVFASMPLDGMLTVCNMTTEISAKTGIMPYKMKEDLKADVADRFTFDISQLEPYVAVPHSPLNGKSVTEIDVEITKAFLGSCTNSRFSDLQVAASILKGKKVKDTVDLYIVPGSRKIYEQIQEEGILSTFIQAGAVILPPNCAACFGKHMGVLGPSDVCISSANRNFVGRMGSKDARVYLASPATVAASAITGTITDPREVLP